MRWDGLRTEIDVKVDVARAAPPLPLALPGAVARTFDTPGFAGMTFYEVQAKSIINKVPGASRVPFSWTVNPYRGCSHACTYCLSGDTPILMADGRTRPLERLRPGDLIYGTVERAGGRRYTITEVLDHWSTVKPAYRIRLADGTELIASGDHRFLTARGWRHVTGGTDRPGLRVGDRLAGVGGARGWATSTAEPEEAAPEEAAPAGPAHGEFAAHEPAAREASVREASVREASVREARAREVSVREASVREARAREVSVREASVREARAREVSVREASVREARAREVSVREASVREAGAGAGAIRAGAIGADEAFDAQISGALAHGPAAHDPAAHDSAAHDSAARDSVAHDLVARDGAARGAAAREAGGREAGGREAGVREAGGREAGVREAGGRGAAARGPAVREPAPPETEDYRRGYLCGAVPGERAVCTEGEALDRIRRYLGTLGAGTNGFRYQRGSGGRAATMTLSTAVPIDTLTGRPDAPSDEWRRGFLAGVFDSEGGLDERGARVGRRDPGMIQLALQHLGFEFTAEPDGAVRLRGGLPAAVRFGQLIDPACRARRVILGHSVETPRSLTVTAIEPLGLRMPLFDITTGTGDFIAAGVVSHNCFARNTHTYLDLDAGHDFDSKVVVKVNAGRLLRRELGGRRWRGEAIAMGTNVDCYQRAEGRYGLMREILGALRDFANPFSILTKGTLILRDLDLLRQAASVTEVGLSMSVGFVDESLWRSVEPGTPSPRRRLDAVKALTDAGFAVGVLMAPILPGITDDDASVEATVAAIADAGATGVTPLPLHLRPGAREWYLGWLRRTRPGLVPRYRELFRGGSYSPSGYQQELTGRVRAMAERYGIGPRPSSTFRQVGPGRGAESPPQAEAPVQLTLL